MGDVKAIPTSLGQVMKSQEKCNYFFLPGGQVVDDGLSQTYRTLLFYTIMMVTLPIFSYFFSKSVFEAILGMSSMNSYFYAAIVAIITVHVILGLFIYAAWNEGNKSFKAE